MNADSQRKADSNDAELAGAEDFKEVDAAKPGTSEDAPEASSNAQSEISLVLAKKIAASSVGRFFEGAAAPWVGMKYLWRHPALWRFAVWPIVANIFITTVILAAIVGAGFLCIAVVHPWIAGETTGAWRWGAILAEIVVGLVLVIAGAFAAMLTYRMLTGILCGYFYGKLAEQVEHDLGISKEKIKSISLQYEMVDTSIDVALIGMAHFVFFAISAIPVVGSLVGAIGAIWFTFFLVGTDYFAKPLALRGVRRVDQFRFSWGHQPMVLGLGAITFLSNFVPILGAVFLTTATVGAVILHRRVRIDEAKLPDYLLGVHQEASE